MLRRRVKHTQSLETRLSEKAKSLREKAKNCHLAQSRQAYYEKPAKPKWWLR